MTAGHGQRFSLTSTAGSILNGGTAFTTNVAAAGLRLSAVAGGAGQGATPLLTAVGTLTASAGTGALFISNTGSVSVGTVAVTVQKVGSPTPPTSAAHRRGPVRPGHRRLDQRPGIVLVPRPARSRSPAR